MRLNFALLLAFALALFRPEHAAAAEITVDAAQNFLIDATINGHPVRLRVDPETSGFIVLNPDAVARIGLRPSMMRSETRIGPVRLAGFSKSAEVTIGGTTDDRRIVWIDRPAIEGADGLIGPADLPFDRVTFRLGATAGNEISVALPLQFERSVGLFLPLTLGEHQLRIQFSLIKPDSLATAAAGAHLAAMQGGEWTGPARDQLIELGVGRPVRPLALGRPLSLDGFELAALLVRTGDNRGNLELPAEPDADPDEVVVTGASRQRARFDLVVGRDRLDRCSRLVWDNPLRTLTLNCRP